MKLIIDIPKDVYEEIMTHNRELRESGKSAYYFEGLIQNGIPYNPTGDLISREALKEQVKNEVCEVCFDSPDERQCSPNCKLCTFKQLIDNAPPVDIKDQIAGAYNEGYMCGNKEAEKARSQGEWIDDKEHTKNPLLWYKCNLCGVYHSPTNFCPNCGADMRKDGKEE